MAPLAGLRPSLLERADTGPARAGGGTAPPGAAVRTTVGREHGVDLSGVPVDRSVSGSVLAGEMNARAFTTTAGVVIPAELGSLDAGPGAAVLAHELTHVAQQARLGPDLPGEHTSEGRQLEAEALKAELALAPAPAARPAEPGGGPHDPGASTPPTGDAGTREQPGPLPVAAPSRAPDVHTLTQALRQLSPADSAPFAFAGGSFSAAPAAPSLAAAPAPAAHPAGAGVQRAEVLEDDTVETQRWVAGRKRPVLGGHKSPRSEEHELSELANKLYPLITDKLRRELRDIRERAGLLTDSYRRW